MFEQLVSLLNSVGCHEIVVCAGARNASLVSGLAALAQFKTWTFFEERSAAFFALGRIQQLQSPVAVVTTSGTAVAELLPGCIEAYYQGCPLLILSADRPPDYRGTGAPQAIEQVGLFSQYVEYCYDWQSPTPNQNWKWSKHCPLHVNICLEEPQRSEIDLFTSDSYLKGLKSSIFDQKSENLNVTELSRITDVLNRPQENDTDFAMKYQRPLFLFGPEFRGVEILKYFKNLKFYSLSEPLSQIKNSGHSVNFKNEKVVDFALEKGIFDSIIRVGGVPTGRIWRDLERKFCHVPVVNFSDQKFSGLSRKGTQKRLLSELDSFLNHLHTNFDQTAIQMLVKMDQDLENVKLDLLKKYPYSEPGWMRWISQQTGAGDKIYLGNSLPIREYDQFGVTQDHQRFFGNRGANGIDGQISTFLGWADRRVQNWGIFGDLTALYDLVSPWLLGQLKIQNLKIVIINNGGGRIFKRMFERSELENEHQIQFQYWAKMWNLHYQLLPHSDERKISKEVSHQILEVNPSPEETDQFWQEWESLCNGLLKC